MEVHFWGVRGSLPTPGPGTLVYGGNTACVEVRCDGRRIVLDAGSGLRALGQALIEQGRACDLDLLLTHTHLDHIIGLPFFKPGFVAGNRIRLWAGHLGANTHLADIVGQLMIPPLLPITPETFRADISYEDFAAGDTLTLADGFTVETAALNHPGGATGYRITHAGRSFCYLTDHEHGPDGPDERLVALARGADLLVYDATFTPEEYPGRVGWGHSHWREAIRFADAAGARQLALFHHLPERTDGALAAIEAEAAAIRPDTFAAREGMTISLATGAVSLSLEPTSP